MPEHHYRITVDTLEPARGPAHESVSFFASADCGLAEAAAEFRERFGWSAARATRFALALCLLSEATGGGLDSLLQSPMERVWGLFPVLPGSN